MSLDPAAAPGPSGRRAYRAAALGFALLHAPLFLALYAPALRKAVEAMPPGYRLAVWPTFLPQALLLALLAFAVALPLSPWPRAYRFAAPAATGLLALGIALDSRVYQAVGFHLNGFLLRVVLEPTGLREIGLGARDVALLLALGAAFLAAETLGGAWLVRRLARAPRRAWPLALAILLLAGAERVYGQVLEHVAGPAAFAAGGVLPLQPPIRMAGLVRKVLGGGRKDPFAGADATRLPPGVDPARIAFTRKPDVLFVVVESTPDDHFDARTFPNAFRRAEAGARFTRHYSTASSTHYAIFSLVYGIQAQKLEATVGAGRRPMLFPAFRANGYDVRMLAASCVDWMGLKETVFGGVHGGLETWCTGRNDDRDRAMVARARELVRATPADQPMFLFLFFGGTHFDYPHDPADVAFLPQWDGRGGLAATTADGALIKNRARNAARTVDRRVEELLADVEGVRGRAPLVVFTADHGEEFREKGHLGHGSDVTDEQVHVPAALFGPGVAGGAVLGAPTSHVDLAPTLFALLGDDHPPARWSDGTDMFRAPEDRFVVATVGWEPRHAVIGKDLKVRMYAGLGSTDITDPEDRPLPDGPARLAAHAGTILRAMRGEPEPGAADGAAPVTRSP